MLSEDGAEIVGMEAQPWTALDPRINGFLGLTRDKVLCSLKAFSSFF